jgi:hypothetical protein
MVLGGHWNRAAASAVRADTAEVAATSTTCRASFARTRVSEIMLMLGVLGAAESVLGAAAQRVTEAYILQKIRDNIIVLIIVN